ncbi:MAG: tail fiber domain-containing protein [Bacteroidota bacterium]
MKTKFLQKMIVLIVVTTFSVFQIQAQTYGKGNLGGTGCVATGTAGDCSDTYIGSSAGSSSTANNLYNTFIGSAAGTSTNGNSAYNTFIGANSGSLNTTGSNNSYLGFGSGFNNVNGSYNTFLGFEAGFYNTAANNTFVGGFAGLNNTSGTSNTFLGLSAGYTNSTGYQNTIFGHQSLYTNTTGYKNTSNGYRALYSNTIGIGNTAIGNLALYSNTTGGWSANSGANTAVGFYSLYYNSTGNKNCAVGEYALYDNTTGFGNTGIGSWTDVNFSNLSNATAIGNGAVVTGSNHVMVGNSAVLEIGGWQPWTSYSDERFKFNIQENVKGLEFINKLRPVTYQLNTHQLDNFIMQNLPDSIRAIHQAGIDYGPATAIVHSGFIAQEVEQALISTGFTSSIVHAPENIADPYALSYAEIVVPLVKAMQELSRKVDSLSILVNPINKSHLQDNNEQNNSINIHELELANNAVLYQNAPNPFGNGTSINYFVPENANAKIVFYDEFGTQIKLFQITENGMGQLKIDASNLSAGMYSYSLIVNGKIVDTKKMIKE